MTNCTIKVYENNPKPNTTQAENNKNQKILRISISLL